MDGRAIYSVEEALVLSSGTEQQVREDAASGNYEDDCVLLTPEGDVIHP